MADMIYSGHTLNILPFLLVSRLIDNSTKIRNDNMGLCQPIVCLPVKTEVSCKNPRISKAYNIVVLYECHALCILIEWLPTVILNAKLQVSITR